jgi:hypothetical protein
MPIAAMTAGTRVSASVLSPVAVAGLGRIVDALRVAYFRERAA